MKYIVDRIEGDFAICEADDQTMVDIPLHNLPDKIKEGDHLKAAEGMYEILPADTDRKERIHDLMDELWG